jgi:Tol biopolymer transport system component
MGLASGHKLGPYEIQSPVGAGGMGEVYRARDNRLDRTVAIKVLPSHLSSSPELKARFEREARAISALQHPNICVLHDVGHQDGVDFLVMEYLEGETLAARIARKALSPDEALKIGIEIADALEKAHRGGIVHRDLKPGNVMLTKGAAKLMDFGLAKPSGLGGKNPESGTPSFSAVATMASMASPVTVAGTLVGTVQYMSPEQIQGKEADARSDIFAFGAMFYEMLSGRRAFEGKSQLSVASSILEKDPEPISAVQPASPPALDYIVRTCLAKEPDDRFQSAHDLKLQLQWIAAGNSQAGMPAAAPPRRKRANPVLTAALVAGWLAAAAASVLAFQYARRVAGAEQLVRARIEQPEGYDFDFVYGGPPVLSPDGLRVAFVATSLKPTNRHKLFVRSLDSGTAQELASTEDASFPFWSPDGKYIGFFAEEKLKKIEAAGGPTQVLCEAPDGRGGAWSPRGVIIFAPRISGPLFAVSDGGGSPTAVTPERKDDVSFTNRNPLFLPDGKHFLYIQRGDKQTTGSVYSASLDGGTPRQVLAEGSNVAYADGYVFYMQAGTLMAQKLDASGLKLQGKPAPISTGVEYYNPRDMGFFSVSRNVLLYRGAQAANRVLAWFDTAGKEIEHWGEPAPYTGGVQSPGGRPAVLLKETLGGSGNSLWLADGERKTITRLTPDSAVDHTGIISPDGNTAYIATSNGYNDVLVQHPLTSSGKDEQLPFIVSGGALFVADLSRDGRYLLLALQSPQTRYDIYSMDLKGDRKLVPLLTSSYSEFTGRISPDDRWLAYVSDESGSLEAYVTAFPGTGAKWQISNGGVNATDSGVSMNWSNDGKHVYYGQGNKIFDVEVRLEEDKPQFSTPREIVTLPDDTIVISILPDGKRILAARAVGDRASPPMDLVLNWKHLVQ